MKKFFLTFALLIVFIMPILLTGCDKNYEMNDVKTKIESIATNKQLINYFNDTTAKFSNGIIINYPDDVTAQINDSSSKMNIIKVVYEPLLYTASAFVNKTYDVFWTNIEANQDIKINQDEINELYNKADAFEKALLEFDEQKSLFVEQTSVVQRINNFLVYYKNLLRATFELNDVYAELYMDYLYPYKDFTDPEVMIDYNTDGTAMMVYYMYNNLKLGYVAFEYYVNNFSYSNDPESNQTSTTIFDNFPVLEEYINYVNEGRTKNMLLSAQGSDEADTEYRNQIKLAIADFQRNKVMFAKDTELFMDAKSHINFEEYFASTNKSYFLSQLSDEDLGYYKFTQNYLDYKFTPHIKWLKRVNDIF